MRSIHTALLVVIDQIPLIGSSLSYRQKKKKREGEGTYLGVPNSTLLGRGDWMVILMGCSIPYLALSSEKLRCWSFRRGDVIGSTLVGVKEHIPSTFPKRSVSIVIPCG